MSMIYKREDLKNKLLNSFKIHKATSVENIGINDLYFLVEFLYLNLRKNYLFKILNK